MSLSPADLASEWREPVPPAGATLGRYRVRGQLGAGGMSVVLRARDVDLDRDVALKVLKHDLSMTDADRAALLREARAMAAVRHPGVVQVHAIERDGDRLFLVMELFAGGSLSAKLEREGRLAPRDAIDVLGRVVDGLEAIHSAGLVHGDVKPSNVLLGEDGRLALTDMGLARAVGADPGGVTVHGTPAYLCPERIVGEPTPGHLAPRQDVYALAAMAFELLTGRVPYEHESVKRVLRAQLEDPIPRASEVAPELSDAFDEPLARALHKDPAARTATARALLRGLEAAARGTDERGRALTFLVADDDDAWRDLLTHALIRRYPSASVFGASDGALAIEQAQRRPPDLALIDLDMPDVNGVGVTGALDALDRDVRVVVISGAGSASDWQLLRRLGADRFFVKPVEVDDLMDSVARLVET